MKALLIDFHFFIYFYFFLLLLLFSAQIGPSSETLVFINGSKPSEKFLGKGILKICSKFTGEHPCRSAISIKLRNRTFPWVFISKFTAYFQIS